MLYTVCFLKSLFGFVSRTCYSSWWLLNDEQMGILVFHTRWSQQRLLQQQFGPPFVDPTVEKTLVPVGMSKHSRKELETNTCTLGVSSGYVSLQTNIMCIWYNYLHVSYTRYVHTYELLRLILSTAISFFASKPPKLVTEESSTCHDRIHWVKDHVFGSRDNNCALAYSKAGVFRGEGFKICFNNCSQGSWNIDWISMKRSVIVLSFAHIVLSIWHFFGEGAGGLRCLQGLHHRGRGDGLMKGDRHFWCI